MRRGQGLGRVLRQAHAEEAKRLVQGLLELPSAEDIEAVVRDYMKHYLADLEDLRPQH